MLVRLWTDRHVGFISKEKRDIRPHLDAPVSHTWKTSVRV